MSVYSHTNSLRPSVRYEEEQASSSGEETRARAESYRSFEISEIIRSILQNIRPRLNSRYTFFDHTPSALIRISRSQLFLDQIVSSVQLPPFSITDQALEKAVNPHLFLYAINNITSHLPSESITIKTDLANVFFTALGIRPSTTISLDTYHKYTPILTLLTLSTPTIRICQLDIEDTDEAVLLVNERPLNRFDPKHYLSSFPDENRFEFVKETFLKNTDCPLEMGQKSCMLAYLYGYGPSWEAFASRVPDIFLSQCPQSVYTDLHFYELGLVLNEPDAPIEVGKTYSHNLQQIKNQFPGIELSIESLISYYGLFQFRMNEVACGTSYIRDKIGYSRKALQEWNLP